MSAVARQYAIKLLAKREYSETELRYKMQTKGFAQEEIAETLAFLQQKNWQSDQRFCESYIRARAQKGYGFGRIQQELVQLKGVDKAVALATLNNMDLDWDKLALATLNKKFPQAGAIRDVKTKQKIWRYMLSHGFSPEQFSRYIGRGENQDF